MLYINMLKRQHLVWVLDTYLLDDVSVGHTYTHTYTHTQTHTHIHTHTNTHIRIDTYLLDDVSVGEPLLVQKHGGGGHLGGMCVSYI
jgi:hypothetical protein